MKNIKFIGISGGLVALAFVMAVVITFDYEDQFVPSTTLSADKIFGSEITESFARENTVVTYKTPTKLPESTILSSIHASDGDHVFIVYSNDNMKDLESFETEGVDIVVYMQKMDIDPIKSFGEGYKPIIIGSSEEGKETKTFEIEQHPPEFVKTNVNGKSAVYLPNTNENVDYSELKWWEQGTLYQVYADLTQTELIDIANSMQ